jgi:hypothetical protein
MLDSSTTCIHSKLIENLYSSVVSYVLLCSFAWFKLSHLLIHLSKSKNFDELQDYSLFPPAGFIFTLCDRASLTILRTYYTFSFIWLIIWWAFIIASLFCIVIYLIYHTWPMTCMIFYRMSENFLNNHWFLQY